MTRDEIIASFMTNATNAAAATVKVSNIEEMNRAVAEILQSGGSVYCPRTTEVEKALVIPEDRLTDDMTTAVFCVEEVFAAVAETGSLVCSSGSGKPIQAGLLGANHVAVLRSENIYATLDDFFVTPGDTPPTNITLETGPSRTADIELTLTIGVHGPESLSVIVL